MTESSVEEIVAALEKECDLGVGDKFEANLRALIADWRKRGEGLLRARELVEYGTVGEWRKEALRAIEDALQSASNQPNNEADNQHGA